MTLHTCHLPGDEGASSANQRKGCTEDRGWLMLGVTEGVRGQKTKNHSGEQKKKPGWRSMEICSSSILGVVISLQNAEHF